MGNRHRPQWKGNPLHNIPVEILITALASWRVSHMLANEAGPFDVFIKLSVWLEDNELGKMMNCVKCLSIWFSLLWFFPLVIRILLSISALVVLLEEANGLLWRSSKTHGRVR